MLTAHISLSAAVLAEDLTSRQPHTHTRARAHAHTHTHTHTHTPVVHTCSKLLEASISVQLSALREAMRSAASRLGLGSMRGPAGTLACFARRPHLCGLRAHRQGDATDRGIRAISKALPDSSQPQARDLYLHAWCTTHHAPPPPMRTTRPPLSPPPQVSNRVAATDAPIIVMTKKVLAASPGAVSLAQGIVHWPPPPEALQAAGKMLQEGGAGLSGYGPAEGLPALRDALKSKVREREDLQPERRLQSSNGRGLHSSNV
jgi:hypothetical protein